MAFALSGCNDMLGAKSSQVAAPACFTVSPNTGNQPFSPMLIDACSGKTWLLVKTRMSDKADDGYTYQWLSIEKFDYTNPVLVSK